MSLSRSVKRGILKKEKRGVKRGLTFRPKTDHFVKNQNSMLKGCHNFMTASFFNRRICFVCTQGGLLGPYCWNVNDFVRTFCTAEVFGFYSVRISTVYRGFRWSACLNTVTNSFSRCSLPKSTQHILSDTQDRKLPSGNKYLPPELR